MIYLAVFLALRVTKHLPERAFLDGLLLWLVQYQQTGMITRRPRPEFQKPQQICPVQPDEITCGDIRAQIHTRRRPK
jgi:hypothetical protein